jgi:hypothetical protein
MRSLKTVCWEAVPAAVQNELECFHRTSVVRNLFFTSELLRLFEVFHRNNIAIIAFKGPVLAESVYGDLSLREFVDLDVLVHRADLCKAEHLFTSCGYNPYIAGRAYRSAFFSYYCQQPFFSQSGIIVDLHWRLASKSVALPIQSTAVWRSPHEVSIFGRKVPTLAPDDLVLLLAAHGTMHGWGNLVWLCDFAELLRKQQEIDWAALFVRAKRAHASRSLLLAILLACTLLDAPAPGDLLLDRARNNPGVRASAEKAKLGMFQPTSKGDFGEFLNGLNTYDRFRDRLWSVARLFTARTVNDYNAMRLPRRLWGLYYLTRPFRLVGRVAKIFKAFSN